MKRTLKPANAKSMNSTTVEKNLKNSNKKKGAGHSIREAVDTQFVRSIVEDVDKVLHERIPCTLPSNHEILLQIKSDLNELLNMLQKDDIQCTNDYSFLNNHQKTTVKTTDAPHNKNKHTKNNFQETIITRNEIIPQNKTIKNAIMNSHLTQTKPVVEMYQQNVKPTNVDERTAAMKTHFEIYPCFNISINSTSESENGVVSESNNVQQLTSFWNDRTKNEGQINCTNTTDHIIDEFFTFGDKEKQQNEMVSKTSLCSLQSNLWQSTLPADLHKSIFCTCDEKDDKNNKVILKSAIPILKDMSTNTESSGNVISHEKQNVTNLTNDDGHIKIIIELIGDFSKNISSFVNLGDDKIETNNKVKEIVITVKQCTDNKLVEKKTLIASSEKPVTTDCDLDSMEGELNKIEKNFVYTQTNDDVDKVSDILYAESPGNISNESVTTNQTEGMDNSDILFSTKPTKYCDEGKPLNQTCKIINETEEMILFGVPQNKNGIEKTVYVGGGDTFFGQLCSESSSLKVNLSICSDDNDEQSDFHVDSNTSYNNETFNNNQLNTIEDKISKVTSTNNVKQKVSDVTIIDDLRSLQVETMIIDKEVGSEYEYCKIKNKYPKHDLQINEETLTDNDGIHQHNSSEISQIDMLQESSLNNKDNIMSECFQIVSKELLQKEPSYSETFTKEIDEFMEIDHSIVSSANKNVAMFKINEEHLKMCQQMLNITTPSDLNKNTFNTSLLRLLEEHIFKHLCNSNDFEYVWQTFQKSGFKLISEHDILALILCQTIMIKLRSNCLSDSKSLFSEINRKVINFKSKTTKCITHCLSTCKKVLKSIDVRQIFSINSAEVFITQCRSSFGHLTAKDVTSYIYHCTLGFSMLYIIEEELFGLFRNSKLVYPF